MLIVLTELVLVACGGNASDTAPCPPSPLRSTPPRVIAHAGGEGLGPANTIPRRLVDDPDVLRMLAAAGVDGVYTRRADIARKVLDEIPGDS